MRSDIFACLPRPAALLLVSTIFQLTNALVAPNHQIPRQTPPPTITIPHRALDVVSWPLRPTPPPGAALFAFRRQQLEENTICGYIGGDSALPATCGAGSHCVVDTEHNVVGCCPNGAPSCTAGVFTGCVDPNSGPQTEVNPYVFSCTGADVCYMNIFDGGYSQFGCGTASDLAATVLNSASGVSAVLSRPTVSLSFTKDASTTTQSTTSGTASRTSSATTSSSPSSTTEDPQQTTTSDAAASAATDSGYKTGAIVGGSIGGLAVLIALVALAFFCIRRRKRNVRQGPGPSGLRSKVISAPRPGGGTGFAALSHDDNDPDAFETGPGGSVFNQPGYQQPQMTHALTTPAATASPSHAHRSMLPPLATGPHMPFQNEISPIDNYDLDTPFAYSGAVAGAASSAIAAAGNTSTGAASVSSYLPSSSGGFSSTTGVPPPGSSDGNQPFMQQLHTSPSSTSFGGPGQSLLMGMNSLLLNRGAERQIESDQIPLTSNAAAAGGGGGGGNNNNNNTGSDTTREIDDFSQGFHAALGRIGEEDEETDEEDERGRYYRRGSQGQNQGQGQGRYTDFVAEGGPGGGGEQAGDAADAAGRTGSVGSAVEGRPLWQQNRRQSRNLMWM